MSKTTGLFSRLWQGYNQSLAARPVLTKSLTSTTGFIVGDSLAQVAMGGGEAFDWERTARFATYGFLVHGPTCHYFYRFLDANIVGKGLRQVATKVAADQLVFTPFGISAFYATITALEGRPEDTVEVIREKFLKTILAGYCVWPAAHVINFRFVPSDLRVLYVNGVQVCWNMVLCQIAAAKPPTTQSIRAQEELKNSVSAASSQ